MRFLRRLSFIETESFAGLLLLVAAAIAMAIANSSLHDGFAALLASRLGPFTLAGWINDGLMALFFFVVGLEIKAEISHGSLSSRDRAALPVVAAFGGMVVPACVYLLFQQNRGWGIPMATDIAFAVGVLSLFRVAPALRIFLLALAVVDDLGAVLVIAIFYTAEIHWLALFAAAFAAFSAYLNRSRVLVFAICGIACWWLVHESGVHATIAGCVLGFLAPRPVAWAKTLHPWSAFGIMPLFALANAGVVFGAGGAQAAPLATAITLGLLVGKPLGILGASWVAIRFRIARAEFSFTDLLGIACLGGIGFTMSIFIASLAFHGEALQAAKLGIVMGSLLSALLGSAILVMTTRMRQSRAPQSSR